MQRKHVPSAGTRYWAALSIVSVFGANLGDFVSNDLHLGHALGVPPMAVLLGAILIAERWDRSWNQAYYWLAIIVIRAAATNLADLATLDLRLGSLWATAGLTLLLAATVLIGRSSASGAAGRIGGKTEFGELPATDARYWTAMVIAGTLGTVIGDFTSYGLELGPRSASVILGAILAAVFYAGHRGLFASVSYYWFTIVVVRAAGTAVGDYLAGSRILNLGLPLSTLCTGLVFAATVWIWKDQASHRLRASEPAF
jgi:uncharacterized membrane-anchored protein